MDKLIRWGTQSTKHAARRGCVTFPDIVLSPSNTSPIYWLWATDNGTLTVWGPYFVTHDKHTTLGRCSNNSREDATRTTTHPNADAAMQAAEQFIRDEYVAHLQNQIDALDAERTRLANRISVVQGRTPPT